jgi:hypothetical protein
LTPLPSVVLRSKAHLAERRAASEACAGRLGISHVLNSKTERRGNQPAGIQTQPGRPGSPRLSVFYFQNFGGLDEYPTHSSLKEAAVCVRAYVDEGIREAIQSPNGLDG